MSTEAQILLWIQENVRQPWLNPIVIFITQLANKGWFWAVTIFIFLCIKKTRKIAVYAIVSVLITYLIGNLCLKNLVARIRPYDMYSALHPLVPHLHDYSFPSGHTSISFCVAMIYYYCFPKKIGIPFVIIAVLIALSRLYVGVHYPTDVLAGFILGSLVAYGIKKLWIDKQKA